MHLRWSERRCDRFLISSDNKLWEIRHNELAKGKDSGKVRIVVEWEEISGLNYDNACKYLAEQYPVEFAKRKAGRRDGFDYTPANATAGWSWLITNWADSGVIHWAVGRVGSGAVWFFWRGWFSSLVRAATETGRSDNFDYTPANATAGWGWIILLRQKKAIPRKLAVSFRAEYGGLVSR